MLFEFASVHALILSTWSYGVLLDSGEANVELQASKMVAGNLLSQPFSLSLLRFLCPEGSEGRYIYATCPGFRCHACDCKCRRGVA